MITALTTILLAQVQLPEGTPWWVPLALAFLAFAGTALGGLFAFLQTKTGKAIKDKFDNEAVGAGLSWAANLAFEMVTAAMQTEVELLKKHLADGKVTQEEYAEQLAAIKAVVLKELQEATVGKLLGGAVAPSQVQFEALTDRLVESAVKKAKSVNPT